MDVKTLTRCSFLCALGITLMYAAALFPTLSLTIVSVAGLMPVAARLNSGVSSGLSVFTVTSLLAILLVPGKDIALLYIAFFGSYPLMKNYFDSIRIMPVRWLGKLVYFNAVFYALWFLARALVFGETPEIPGFIFLLQAFLNLFFVVFDAAVGKIIKYYLSGILKHFK